MKKFSLSWAALLSILFLFSCADSKDNPVERADSGTLLERLDAKTCGIEFVNNVNEDFERNSMFYDYFLNGGGVSIGDIDNDGLPDIFFTGNDVDDRLYLNKGDFQFEDKTKEMGIQPGGWSTGTTMVDINNDGFLDIYVCRSGDSKYKDHKQNLLYINNAGEHFTESAAAFGLAETGQSISASFFDYDKDGDLDVWINNHINYDGDVKALVNNIKAPDASRKAFRSRLYRNDFGNYKDVTVAAGVSRECASLGVVTSDLNSDGLIDIYVSNDYEVPDYYFLNNGDGTFREASKEKIGHTSFYSMGIDAADINNDGYQDLIAVDMTPQDHVRNKVLMASMNVGLFNYLYDELNLTKAYMFNTFQMGRGDGHFSEIGNYMGTGQTEWSWAPLFADFDNDGYKDLYISNGYLRDSKDNDFKLKVEAYKKTKGVSWNKETWDYCMTILNSTPVENKVFRFDGTKMHDSSDTWTDGSLTFSNGAAYGDLDNDGDLDLVVNNLSQPPSMNMLGILRLSPYFHNE